MKQKTFLFTVSIFVNFVFGQTPNLILLSPSSNTYISSGSEIVISWSSFNVKSIHIGYSLDDGYTWQTIEENIPAQISNLVWTLPNRIDSVLYLRLISVENGNVEITRKIKVGERINVNESVKDLRQNNSLSKTAEITKIMPLGDSITEGIAVSDDEVGYRRALDSLLNAISLDFDYVGSKITGLVTDFDRDHEGHSGWHAKHNNLSRRSIVDSLYKWLENAHPDVILLHIGTNDIGELDIFNESAQDVVNDVEEILDIVDLYEADFDKTVMVFVAQIIKQFDDPSTPTLNEEDSTIVYNNLLGTLVQNSINSGDNLVLVNHEDKISYPGDLADGIHPNDNGYRKMAVTWFNAIAQDLNYNPIILRQPANEGTLEGNSIEFKISVDGLEPLTVQWYKNDLIVKESTDEFYSIDSVALSDDESSVYCKVFNEIDTVYSDTVDLFVTPLNEKVDGGILTYYDFEEGSGEIINDSVSSLSQANLVINSPSATEWIDHGLIVNSPTSIVSDSSAVKIYERCIATSELTVEAWIKPGLLEQTGPARIVTLSNDGTYRNFTLGQEQDQFVVRLRTSETDNNGQPEYYSTENSADTQLTHLVFSRSINGRSILYINGIKNSEFYIPGNFANWDPGHLLGLANEFNTERPWIGSYYQVSLYNRALDSLEVRHNYLMGETGITEVNNPGSLQVTGSSIGEIDISWIDNSVNENGFIIRRSEIDSTSFVNIDTTLATTLSFTDTTISEGIPYYYGIVAFNDFDISELSNIVYLVSQSNVVSSPTALAGYADTLGNVILNWENSADNNFGFIIERRPDLPDSNFSIIDSTQNTTFTDSISKAHSTYEYRVKGFNFALESSYSNIAKISGITDITDQQTIINEFHLLQNYPNPFNPTTTIDFSIQVKSNINLEVFNSLGEKIRNMVQNKVFDPGNYSVKFNADNLPSGIYFYRLKSNSLSSNSNFSKVRKMIMLK